jgi:transcriptional regulator with XRE-family HTH domain
LASQEKRSISDLLLREMEARNWSQREMAKACALSNTTISKIVRQQSMPDPNTCFKLARGLALPIHYVLELAGHEIADAQPAPPSLEAFLHAQFAHLPEQAIQEMIGATRAIESAYTTPSTQDLDLARSNLEALEFIRRWLDPVKRQVLTVVQGERFLFYQTADLDPDGREINRGELTPLRGDPGTLSMFPVHHLARDAFHNSFCVQLYPFAEFDAHRCQSHPQHATLFTPIYAGDRGPGVRVIYPDGRQVTVRDQVMERAWEKIYAARGASTLPGPDADQGDQIAAARARWQDADADELWLNPDARTYAAFFAPDEGDTAYCLLTGPLAETSRPGWRAQSAVRIEVVDTTLYGRFETSVVHLQGFCIRLAPHVEHVIPTRHIVPSHRTLIWRERDAHHVLVLHEYLETWLHIRVGQKEGKTWIEVIKDLPLRAEVGRRRIEEQIQELVTRQISFSDSSLAY